MNLFVFFHVTPRRRPGHAARVLSIASKRPSIARKVATGWIIENMAGSPLTHVTVADNDVALVSRVSGGDCFTPLIPFIDTAPGLAWLFEIPCDDGFRLQDHADPHSKSVTRAVIGRASGGIVRARSCVTTAAQAIRSAGHRVPGRIVTPAHLFDWLRSEGHAPHDLSDAGYADEQRVADAAARYVETSRADIEALMRESQRRPGA